MRPPIASPLRRAAAWTMAVAALTLALAPWVGRAVLPMDGLSSALPIVPVLALCAIALARTPAARLVAAAAVLLGAPILATELWPRAPAARTPGPSMVVVTHNVAVANVDPAATADVLLGSGADIILLQETNGTMQPALARLRTRFPFGSRCARPCSTMILSRWPTTRVRYRFRDADGHPFGPALEQTEVRVPGLPPVPVVTLHLSRHRAWAAEAGERTALVATIRRNPDGATILGGDFNLTPWSAALRGLDAGLRPLRRVTRAAFSWPARLGEMPFPVPLVPIDQLYAGPRWAVRSVQRLPRTGSDHYPLRVELVWQR